MKHRLVDYNPFVLQFRYYNVQLPPMCLYLYSISIHLFRKTVCPFLFGQCHFYFTGFFSIYPMVLFSPYIYKCFCCLILVGNWSNILGRFCLIFLFQQIDQFLAPILNGCLLFKEHW